MALKKEKPTPDGEVASSKPSAPQKIESPEGAKPLISELIQSAETFDELIEAFKGSEGIPQKIEGRDSFYTGDEVRIATNDLLGFLDVIATSSNYLLNTPAETLGKDHVKFNSIPEEGGLREKMMELYDKRRVELLKAKTESPAEEAPAEAPREEKMFIEPLVSDEVLDEFASSYLDTVVTYRIALEDAYERLKALEEDRGLGSMIKKHILRKTPELSEDEEEHLRELRNATEIEWKRIHDSLKQTVLGEKAGSTEEFSHILASLGERISAQTAKKERGGVIIPKTLMSEYEGIVFTKLHADPTVSPEEMKRHLEYLERKKAEQEVEAAVGIFVPTKTEEETAPVKAEEQISPEKSITALQVLQKMRGENSETVKRAKELMEKTAKNAYGAVMAGGEWYKKLPKGQKIALTCAFASIGLIGAATSAPLLFGTALVGKTVQRTLVASGTAAGINALLTAKAERERSEGKAESWVSKRKELISIGGGLAAFVLPKIFSAEARHIVSEIHITDHIKSWFSSVSPVSVTTETIPVTTEIHTTPTYIPETSVPENVDTSLAKEVIPESTPVKPDIPTARRAIFIDDKLGKKGNSIWGALKHNGVSERAIANYEKAHPGEIERRARNGDIVTFTYDKDSNVLKDVKFESALKKVAKGAKKFAENQVATAEVHEYDTAGQKTIEANLSTKEHGVTSGEVHQQEMKAQKIADAEAKKHEIIEKKTRSKVRGMFSKESTKIPIEGPLPSNEEIAAGNETLDLYKDTAILDTTEIPQFIPFNVTDIEAANPKIATEMRGYFSTAENKSWYKLSTVDASKVLSAKDNNVLKNILGKRGYTLADAISGQHMLATISNESGIKPNKGEKVLEYMERAVQKLSKVAQK